MESVIQSEKACYLCGRNGNSDRLEEHHIFNKSERKFSEKYGLKVWLCGERCHRNGKYAVHRCNETAVRLKREAQEKFEETHTREEFMQIFGKNYLD